jgi:hypothetical protein
MGITNVATRLLAAALLLAVIAVSACTSSSAADRAQATGYIVVLVGDPPATPDAAARVRVVADSLVAQHGGTVERVFGTALNGFSARLTPAQAKAVAGDKRVRYVEPDGEMRTQPRK